MALGGWITPVWPLAVDVEGMQRETIEEFVKRLQAGPEVVVRTGAMKASLYADLSPTPGVWSDLDYPTHVENAANSPHRGTIAGVWENWKPDDLGSWGKGLLGV